MGDLSFFTKTQEPYSFLLERREWKAKRLKIINRDHCRCVNCGSKEGKDLTLHVHHKHYIYGLDPWEYKDSELVTLCEQCHSEVHEAVNVPVYRLDDGNLVEVHLTPCKRCSGSGWLSQYKHVQDGICFRCLGAKYDELIEVVENYAEEHDIRIEDIDDGFEKLTPEVEGIGTIVRVEIKKSVKSNCLYCRVVFKAGASFFAVWIILLRLNREIC